MWNLIDSHHDDTQARACHWIPRARSPRLCDCMWCICMLCICGFRGHMMWVYEYELRWCRFHFCGSAMRWVWPARAREMAAWRHSRPWWRDEARRTYSVCVCVCVRGEKYTDRNDLYFPKSWGNSDDKQVKYDQKNTVIDDRNSACIPVGFFREENWWFFIYMQKCRVYIMPLKYSIDSQQLCNVYSYY